MASHSDDLKQLPSVTTDQGDFAFVCYSHRDIEIVHKDLFELNRNEIPVWYDEAIYAGSDWTNELAEAIDNCSLFIFFASKDSITSDYCRNECVYAIEKKKAVMTIYVDDCELPPGLKLALGANQAIQRSRYKEDEYHEKMVAVIGGILTRGTFDSISTDSHSRNPKRYSPMLFAAVVLITLGILFASIMTQENDFDDATVAILPFTGSDESSVVHGQILASLTSLPELKVTPRTDVSALLAGATQNLSTREIGELLKVSYLLDGDIQKEGQSTTLSVYLSDTQTGFNIWTEKYDLRSDVLENLPLEIERGAMESVRIFATTPTTD
jgi:TolB-like protein